MPPLAWVTGAGGLIGSHLVARCPGDWQARGLTRKDLELTDFAAVRGRFAEENPALIIHAAALSKTPECESHPNAAWENNVEVTRLLCDLAKAIPLLFLSTDLVFDGTKGNYAESDPPAPLNVYALTKVAAENIVLANPRHAVIRTSLNVGMTAGGTAFNEQLRAAWREGQATKLFIDEFRSPIPADVTARAIWELIAAEATGIFHIGGSERLSRFDIGRLLADRHADRHPRIEPVSIVDYHGPRRSPDTTLDSSKAQAQLSFPLPRFSDWLKEHPQLAL
jgi:dTDP-4-dehydrorhamnose reductase